MKNLLYLLFILLLTGCREGPTKSLDNVNKAFPDAEIRQIPRSQGQFIVKNTNGSIWYVETFNLTDSEISQKVLLIK